MTISIIVIISCLGLAAMFIICCFWSPCPLFDTCRVNYGRRLNIAYGKKSNLFRDNGPSKGAFFFFGHNGYLKEEPLS